MSIYAKAWRDYHEQGFAPLPLPPRDKFPPPSGWTGGGKKNSGKMPTEAQCEKWAKQGYGTDGFRKPGNIALRLPKNVIGIDVDMYDGKAGRETLAEAEERWGVLPQTWVSTSRLDGSGIRLFRIPEGLSWASLVGDAGSGIEIVRWDHRYAVACPSIHPNGEMYVWVRPDGERVTDELPAIEDLAELPAGWVEGLTNGRQKWKAREEAELTREEVSGWVSARPDADAEMCDELHGTVRRSLADMDKAAKGGGLHEAALKAVWGVLRDAAHGHAGVLKGLSLLREGFLAAAGVRGKGRTVGAEGEWFRSVSMGVCKVAAEVATVDERAGDPCGSGGEEEWSPEKRQSLADIPEQFYPLTDIGNSQRFQRLYGEDVRWYGAEGMWLVWRGDRWQRDRVGLVEARAKKVADFVEHTEAAKFDGDDTDRFKALKGHAKALGKRTTRAAMLDDYKSMREVTVVPEQIDANPRFLQCEGRLVELKPDGVAARTARREDYQTLTAGAEYDPEAVFSDWDKFLLRAMPDDEVRRWVQKAVGYSLLGGNPERLMFFIKGKTSTGKSVFAEAIAAALGEYSSTFDMTLFKSQKEQGPNVQLVRMLDKRVIFTSETSSDRHLHADQMKRMTGGDQMSARLNRSNDLVEKVPAFTPWVMTNHAPTVNGADQALYRRLLCIPFEQQIPEEEVDVRLMGRLKGEGRTAVLAWAVEGWRMYAREGLRDVPSAVAIGTMGLRAELSFFSRWLDEECEQESGAAVTTADLYSAYELWCAENGLKEVDNKIVFGRRLTEQLGAERQKFVKRQRGWSGIRLKVSG